MTHKPHKRGENLKKAKLAFSRFFFVLGGGISLLSLHYLTLHKIGFELKFWENENDEELFWRRTKGKLKNLTVQTAKNRTCNEID